MNIFRLIVISLLSFSLSGSTTAADNPKFSKKTPKKEVVTRTFTQNSYFINLSTIKVISCENKNGAGYGTGIVIAQNRIITANHVVISGDKCFVNGIPAKIVSQYPELDFAVLEADLGPNNPVTQFSCDGFKKGETYFSLGFARMRDFAMTKLIASGEYQDVLKNEEYPYDNPAMSVLSGLMIRGMSGGPVIDMNGKIVGINNVSNENGFALSRALKDTPLCDALREPDSNDLNTSIQKLLENKPQ